MTASGGRGRGRGGGVSVVVPLELVEMEVLTRLPAKSLMRFKCVSKVWRSTICDPSFSKAHRARSPSSTAAAGLFLSYIDGHHSLRCFYATVPRDGESVLLDQLAAPPPDSQRKYIGATEVINGLCVLYSGNRFSICNISTREIIELPLPSETRQQHGGGSFYYNLGFASTSKQYKLLEFYRPFGYDRFLDCSNRWQYCGIITLGKGEKWRKLQVLDGYNHQSVNVDGFLCWWRQSSRRVFVFNFEYESLHTIDLPPIASYSLTSLQFRGHFALARKDSSPRVTKSVDLWLLCIKPTSSLPSYEWVNEVVDIPDDTCFSGCDFHGHLPTDAEMLFTCRREINVDKSVVPVHSYSHPEKKLQKFVIGKFPTGPTLTPDKFRFRLHYYKEDVTRLKDLISIKDS